MKTAIRRPNEAPRTIQTVRLRRVSCTINEKVSTSNKQTYRSFGGFLECPTVPAVGATYRPLTVNVLGRSGSSRSQRSAQIL